MEDIKSFEPDEIVIKEGEKGTSAFVIMSGTAKVIKNLKGKEYEMAILGEGQVFGEMGLIEDRPRSATVKADTTLYVRTIDRDQFNELLITKPSILIPILKNLFERIRQASELLVEKKAETSNEIGKEKAVEVVMEGQTAEAKAILNDRKLLITKFPFLIGRYSSDDMDSDVFHHNDLFIKEEKPYYISRNHLAVHNDRGTIWAVDRGSAFGVIVNGKEIGGESNENRAPLDKEENQIIIGPVTSKYIFLFQVIPAE